MEFTVREINENDFDGLMQLYTELHDNKLPQKTVSLLNLWNKILKDNTYHIIVAEKDGNIISSCTCVIISNLTHNQRPYALIENVITNRDYRKQGAATQCLNFAAKIAKNSDCYKIMLLTGAKDDATLDFYRKAGYNSEDKTAFIKWL